MLAAALWSEEGNLPPPSPGLLCFVQLTPRARGPCSGLLCLPEAGSGPRITDDVDSKASSHRVHQALGVNPCSLTNHCTKVCLASALWVHFQMALNAASKNKSLSQQQTVVIHSPGSELAAGASCASAASVSLWSLPLFVPREQVSLYISMPSGAGGTEVLACDQTRIQSFKSAFFNAKKPKMDFHCLRCWVVAVLL